MRLPGTMIRGFCTVLLSTVLIGTPALAQQATPSEGFPLPLDPLRPADTGKPRIFAAPPLIDTRGCAPLDCRVRVIGTVQRNGAVELNATAFRW